MILHEPSRHEKHVLDVQRVNVLFNLRFGIEMYRAASLAFGNLCEAGEGGPDDLGSAGGDIGVDYSFALGYLYHSGGFLPDCTAELSL
jgi:hypothetical protein